MIKKHFKLKQTTNGSLLSANISKMQTCICLKNVCRAIYVYFFDTCTVVTTVLFLHMFLLSTDI